ncbi:MAG: hypothetical protein GEV28_23730 [Actinophytocola sp.]|uniref:hypothetical protein n=1 Tax=Actinophytocola sp. TaxID=1872138 RepID=UPI0013273D80|nr:hypothetical protein [Actinophytocola sp.]MPZ83237.1 hypothetical protein [Actinophytocola sp.]
MPACDICNASPGPDAKRYPAKQLRAAADGGYRPRAVVDGFQAVAARLGVGDADPWGTWLDIVRRDRSDWLLCRPCAADLDNHLRKVAAGPLPPRRRGLFGRRP